MGQAEGRRACLRPQQMVPLRTALAQESTGLLLSLAEWACGYVCVLGQYSHCHPRPHVESGHFISIAVPQQGVFYRFLLS